MLAEIEEANFDIVIIDNFFLHRNFYLIPAKLGNLRKCLYKYFTTSPNLKCAL